MDMNMDRGKLLHEIEQNDVIMRSMANQWAVAYKQLVSEGVPSAEAAQMVCAWIRQTKGDG